MTAPARRRPAGLLSAYLPQTLLRRCAADRAAAPRWWAWLDGALMHCDISGFTAMSERLAARGKEGAELMAAVLNSFFEPMLGIAARHGGVQVKFGGDAMLLFFDGPDGARRAAAAGLEMQEGMRDFRRVDAGGETHELKMRAGVHAGRFLSLSVGGDGTLHYLLLGPDVSRATEVEAEGRLGHVVVSDQAAAGMREAAALRRHAPGLWTVRSVDAPRVDVPAAPPDAPAVVGRYLPPPIRALVEQSARPPAEHRRVTVMFIHVAGAAELIAARGEDETLRQVGDYVSLAIDAIERNAGVLIGSDASEHGTKLVALFGAPVSTEDDEANALRCALDLQRELPSRKLDLAHAIGVNTGPVFAGEIGSRSRREYTVIGDAVNLAARLMTAAADGETLVSQSTIDRAGDGFAFRGRRPIRVKGKSQPVRLARLEGRAEASPARARAGDLEFVGRDQEVARLLPLLDAARDGPGPAPWAYISGDPGIGKSRLAEEFAARAAGAGMRRLDVVCRRHTTGTPLAAWGAALRELFGVRSDDPSRAVADIARSVARIAPDLAPFASLVAEAVGLPRPDDPLVDSLDAKTRKERLSALVLRALRSWSSREPAFIAVEDSHYADALSLELLAAAIAAGGPLLACVTSRDHAVPQQLSARPSVVLRLAALGEHDALRLLEAAGAASDRARAISRRAQGNPLFLRELASMPPDATTPESVNDVILARLDALPPAERNALRLASVIGPAFELRALRAMATGDHRVERLPDLLPRLVDAGFLRTEGRTAAFAFRHGLTRDVAYETLLYADRRSLHRRVAAFLLRTQPVERVSGDLLEHFERADEHTEAVRYAVISGDRAASLYAGDDAVAFYRRALHALDRAGARTEADRSVVLERIGDALETRGDHRDAIDSYTASLEHWRAAPARRAPLATAVAVDRRSREAALCRKVAVSYERSSEYDRSIEWLDRALASAPKRSGTVTAQVCASMSVALFRKGRYRDGVAWGRRALALATRGNDARTLAYAHSMLASSHVEQGELRRAVAHLRPALALYEELRDMPGQAAAGNNLGSCYQLLGILDGALYHYEAALRVDEQLGNSMHATIIHNNIGEVLLTLGRVDEAVEHLELVVRAQAKHPELTGLAGLAYVNLSRCRLVLGDLRAARSDVDRGIRLLERVRARGVQAEAELQRVEVLLARRRYRDALAEAQRTLDTVRELDAKLLEARAQRLVGVAQLRLGDLRGARDALRQSVALARRSGAELEEVQALLAAADVVAADGRRPARRDVERAVDIAARIGAEPERRRAERYLD